MKELRTRHAKITHEHLIKKTDSPFFDRCQKSVTARFTFYKNVQTLSDREGIELIPSYFSKSEEDIPIQIDEHKSALQSAST